MCSLQFKVHMNDILHFLPYITSSCRVKREGRALTSLNLKKMGRHWNRSRYEGGTCVCVCCTCMCVCCTCMCVSMCVRVSTLYVSLCMRIMCVCVVVCCFTAGGCVSKHHHHTHQGHTIITHHHHTPSHNITTPQSHPPNATIHTCT